MACAWAYVRGSLSGFTFFSIPDDNDDNHNNDSTRNTTKHPSYHERLQDAARSRNTFAQQSSRRDRLIRCEEMWGLSSMAMMMIPAVWRWSTSASYQDGPFEFKSVATLAQNRIHLHALRRFAACRYRLPWIASSGGRAPFAGTWGMAWGAGICRGEPCLRCKGGGAYKLDDAAVAAAEAAAPDVRKVDPPPTPMVVPPPPQVVPLKRNRMPSKPRGSGARSDAAIDAKAKNLGLPATSAVKPRVASAPPAATLRVAAPRTAGKLWAAVKLSATLAAAKPRLLPTSKIQLRVSDPARVLLQ